MKLNESHTALILAMQKGTTIEKTHSEGRFKAMVGIMVTGTKQNVTSTASQLIKGDYINGKTLKLTAKGAKYER